MLKKIVVKGAKEHNLKNVSLEIPKEISCNYWSIWVWEIIFGF